MPLPARPYHILCYTHQAIPYTMPCPPGHTICPWGHNIYHAMLARPYHTSCYVYPGYTIYHAMSSQSIPCHARQAIRYTMPCLPGHTIYHAMPASPYHITCHVLQAISYTMPCSQTIPYTMSCLPGHTIYHVMLRGSSRPSSRNGKGPNGHVTRCPIVMSVVKEDDSFLCRLLLIIHKRSMMHCGSVLA